MDIPNHQELERGASNPWKCWATIGLSLAIGVLAVVGQIIFAVVWTVVAMVRAGTVDAEQMTENGNFLLGCTLFSYPFVMGFMALFIKIRKGNTLADYLTLRKTGIKPLLIWTGWTCALLVLMEVAGTFFQQDPPAIMIQLFSTGHTGLIFFTLVLAAPIVEELFFRGFMFKGMAASRIGGVGAVALSSFFWAAIHGFQYGWFPLLYLFFFGIILGMARLKTGSIMVPLILHIANNLLSAVTIKVMLDQGLI